MNNEINHNWKEYSNLLLEFIKRRIKDPADAEDILQEVFLKILSKIDTLKNSEKLKSWMYQITRNAISDYYRAKSRENNTEGFIFTESETEEISMMKDAEGWIGLYIEELPENYKQALILSEMQGMPISKIAENMNISYTNARARVDRGRKALKKNLTDCCTFNIDAYGNIIEYHRNPVKCKNC